MGDKKVLPESSRPVRDVPGAFFKPFDPNYPRTPRFHRLRHFERGSSGLNFFHD